MFIIYTRNIKCIRNLTLTDAKSHQDPIKVPSNWRLLDPASAGYDQTATPSGPSRHLTPKWPIIDMYVTMTYYNQQDNQVTLAARTPLPPLLCCCRTWTCPSSGLECGPWQWRFCSCEGSKSCPVVLLGASTWIGSLCTLSEASNLNQKIRASNAANATGTSNRLVSWCNWNWNLEASANTKICQFFCPPRDLQSNISTNHGHGIYAACSMRRQCLSS